MSFKHALITAGIAVLAWIGVAWLFGDAVTVPVVSDMVHIGQGKA